MLGMKTHKELYQTFASSQATSTSHLFATRFPLADVRNQEAVRVTMGSAVIFGRLSADFDCFGTLIILELREDLPVLSEQTSWFH